MKLKYLLLLVSILALPAAANVEQDVDILIEQIAQSPCTFIRNGESYDQHQAAEHIRKKWHYAKDDVTDIQVFISEVASKSWFSGKPYMVKCGETQITSEAWLNQLWQQAEQP